MRWLKPKEELPSKLLGSQHLKVIIFFIIVSLVFNLYLASLIVSLIVTSRIVKLWVGQESLDSNLFSYIFSAFVYLLILQCMTLAIWLTTPNLSLMLSIPLSLIFVVLYYFASGSNSLRARNDQSLIKPSDFIAILISLVITFIVLAVPLTQSRSSGLRLGFINTINASVDDGAHLALINDRLQFDRGVLDGTTAHDQSRWNTEHSNYPAGWHSANAAIIKSILPNIKTGSESLILYSLSKVFWLFILSYVFTKVAFMIFNAFSGTKSMPIAVYVWLSGTGLLFCYTAFVNIFRLGFYNFIPQLIAILLLVVLSLQLKNPDNTKHEHENVVPLAVLICLGGSLTWVLLLPALGTSLLLVTHGYLRSSGRTLTRTVTSILRKHFLLVGLCVMAILAQLLILKGDAAQPGPNLFADILLKGNTARYNEAFIIFVLLGTVLCGLLASKKSSRQLTSVLYIATPLVFLSMLIFFFQMVMMGRTEYYFHKSMEAFYVVVFPLAITGFALVFNRIAKLNGFIQATMISLVVLLGSIQLIGLNSLTISGVSALDYAKGKRPTAQQLNRSVSSMLVSVASADNYFDKVYYFYYVPTSGYTEVSGKLSDISTLLVKSNKPDSTCFRQTRRILLKLAQFSDQLNFIMEACRGKEYSIRIVTDESAKQDIEQVIKNKGFDKYAEVMTYDRLD